MKPLASPKEQCPEFGERGCRFDVYDNAVADPCLR